MCALQPPFNGANIATLALQIVSGKYPALPKAAKFSADLERLIGRMLTVDSKKRITID